MATIADLAVKRKVHFELSIPCARLRTAARRSLCVRLRASHLRKPAAGLALNKCLQCRLHDCRFPRNAGEPLRVGKQLIID